MLDFEDLILVAVLALGMSCGIGATSISACQAPVGYEDETGFHFS